MSQAPTPTRSKNGNGGQAVKLFEATAIRVKVFADGYPVEIEIKPHNGGKVGEAINQLTGLLKAGGYDAPIQASTATAEKLASAAGPPVCPIHNKAMKPSRSPGKFFCSARDGDDYCKHTEERK